VAASIVIDPRFNGPPESGNGGYTCGLLAHWIDGPARVTLRSPPPLGVPLAVIVEGGRARLVDGEVLVAEAEPTGSDPSGGSDPPGEPPAAVSVDEARAAAARSAFLEVHPFPTCFVCGPRRAEHDGLRIYAGPVEGRDLFAAPWTPAADLARGDGTLPAEIVWAALDCPTSAPGMNEPGPDGSLLPIVLARLAVDLRAPVEAGAEHVVTSWEIGRDGRKREAGSALFDAGGRLLASARALWIELRAAG
jgi:hypothetical protein